jgi:hypothetical protein
MDKWNIVFSKGSTYQQTIQMQGVADIASATGWTVRCAFPGAAPFLTATIANGMIIGEDPDTKTLIVPAATTDTFELGNARFDFEITWAGNVVRRYYANGLCQINPEVGEV